MQYQSMNNNNNNNRSFDQNESMTSVPSERRKRSEPLVASPQWKATHHTKARSIRPVPHQRFSMSLRWLIQKKQQKDLAAQASTVNTDASAVASNDKDAKKSDAKKRGGIKMSGATMRAAGVLDGVMRRNAQDTKEKNKNAVEAETKRTKSKKKTIIKKKTSKKNLDSSFDLDSELAALQQEFAEL